jgi:hypothetical protein
MVATIRRRRTYRSRIAWTWRYDVELDGCEIAHGVDRLTSAISAARRAAKPQHPIIIRAWALFPTPNAVKQ